ncbi:MAG TPA: adenosylmethionine decarboxylase [Gemmataceae bacterium]|nr:adenosylmethionine decarboxylase [Gemmataceae bacterium]
MIGKHLLADFYGIAAARLDAADLLAECLLTAARCCGLTPLAPPLLHRFPAGGVTGVLLLAESHIALHTYPEHGYLALDIFSCGPGDPQEALACFRRVLQPARESVTCTSRGSEVTP